MVAKYCCSGIVGEAIAAFTAKAMIKVKKVIKTGIVHLTKIKSELLNREYENLQALLHGTHDVELYSANKQQAKRFYKHIKPDKEYPLSIRKDLLKVEERDTKIAKYWVRIPVKGRRGGVWVAIKPHCDPPAEYEICESKLMRKKDRFFLNITIQKDVTIEYPANPSAVIAVDIGEANPLSFCLWQDGRVVKVGFNASEVRGIRTHLNHVRKEIGRKKAKHALTVIKRIGDAEQRRVRDAIHKATREIVKKAKELKEAGHNVVIAVGDLKDLRRKRRRYRWRLRLNNRKVNTMPSFMVKKQIEYKALWDGVPVVFVNEAYTSRQCWRCGSEGIRDKRRFLCQNCGLDYNADLNGARNILNRSLGYMLRDRAVVDQPLSSTVSSFSDEENKLEDRRAMGEATQLVGW